MLNCRNVGSDDLNLVHARVAGWHSGRKELLRQLERVPLASLALGTDEILFVPRLHLREVAGERLADATFETLKGMAATAEYDPPPGKSGSLACRFSSRRRYLAWLVGLWLGGPTERAAVIAATATESLRQWQRRDVLCDGPVLVAVTARLAEARLAVDWIARFEPHDHELAEASLARSFGIDLRMATSKPSASQPHLADARPAARHPVRRQEPTAGPIAGRSIAETEIAELCRELDQADHDWRRLPPRGRLMLLVLLSLARTPAHASRSKYVSAIAAAAAVPTEFLSELGDAKLPTDRPTKAKRPTVQRAGEVPAESRRRHPIAAEARAKYATVPPSGDGFPSPTVARLPNSDESARAGEQSSLRAVPAAPARTPLLETETDAPAVDQGLSFQSNFAGLLFLLNAFVALGLYPDFANRERPRLAVSPLWLIDRVSAAWFGRRYRRDPLHRWLVANSSGGRLPRDWEVEDSWCNAWESPQGTMLLERAGRATLWHPAGFPLADMRAHRLHRIDLGSRTRLRIGRRDGRCARHVPRLPTERTQRWIACLALFLDARIRAATGHQAMGLSTLALPGEVIVHELDVCARFSLDRHPIPLRLAGLDRNPAWQPAEGRSFRFHFS